MDRAIVLTVLLLVGLTWVLYKLTELLEPRGDKPPQAEKGGAAHSSQKLIHQRLRK